MAMISIVRTTLMVKILIADDEEQTRLGIKKFLKSLKVPIDEIETAANGEDALHLVHTFHPDILITDVVMPRMDGIELVKQAKIVNGDIKVIMISGHNELDYLKSALKYEASDYILKPIDIQELSNVLNLVIDRIEKEVIERREEALANRKLEESLPLLREKFALDFLDGCFSDREYLSERMDFLDLPVLKRGRYAVVDLLLSEIPEDTGGKSARGFGNLPICAFIRQQATAVPGLLVISASENEMLLVLSFFYNTSVQEYMQATLAFLEQLQAEITRQFNRIITVGIGNLENDIMDVPRSYRQSIDAANQRFHLGKGVIVFFSDIQDQGRFALSLPKGFEKKLMTLILSADNCAIVKELDVLFQSLSGKATAIEGKAIQQFKLELTGFALQTVKESGISIDSFGDDWMPWDRIMKLDTITEIRQWFEGIVLPISSLYAREHKGKTAFLVDKARQIIQTGYHEPINVQIVADRMKISSSYLSAVFKQEMKVGLSDYLIEFRMAKAKDFLKDTSLKIHDVGVMVGYDDQNYFARSFRKSFGVSPTEYRETMTDDNPA